MTFTPPRAGRVQDLIQGIVLGVVPVLLDDGKAPHGSSALRLLAGGTLVERTVRTLVGSGSCDHVLVVADAQLLGVLNAILAPITTASVLATEGTGGETLGALGARYAAEVVVYHDPDYPLVSAHAVRAVLEALAAERSAAAAVLVRSVTDTLKSVDDCGVVRATADREAFLTVLSPCAVRATALVELDESGANILPAGPGPALVSELADTGARIVAVPAAEAVLCLKGQDGLMLAEAVVAGQAGSVVKEPASGRCGVFQVE